MPANLDAIALAWRRCRCRLTKDALFARLYAATRSEAACIGEQFPKLDPDGRDSEINLALLKAAISFDGSRRFKTWFWVVAHRRLCSFWKYEQRRQWPGLDDRMDWRATVNHVDDLAAAETFAILWRRAKRLLTPTERIAFYQTQVRGRSYAYLRRRQGWGKKTVTNAVQRAKHKLRRGLVIAEG